MKKKLLVVITLVLLIGVTMTVFALNHGNGSENGDHYWEDSELEFGVCPLEPEPEVEASDC